MRPSPADRTPVETVLAAFDEAGRKRRPDGSGGYFLSCPGPVHANGDRNPSLHMSENQDGNVLLLCQAGCDTSDVLHAVGLELRDLFAPQGRTVIPIRPVRAVVQTGDSCSLPACIAVRKTMEPGAECSATYFYTDADGTTVGQVHRYTPKTFRPFTVDTNGQVRAGGRPMVPYQLPRILDVLANGGTVLVVEGEKDADRVNLLGRDDLAATTNAAGAGKWGPEQTSYLTGHGGRVLIVGDTDSAGQEHVRKIQECFLAAGAEAPGVSFPTRGKDLSEHLDNGGDLDELLAVLQETPEPPTYPRLGRVLSLQELQKLPPIRPLIDGWLSTPSAAVLVGAYGLGKSAVTLSMACSIATGTPFLGIPTEQRRVLYVVGEGSRGLPRRVQAWEQTWNRSVPESGLQIMDRMSGSLKDLATWRDLVRYCQDNEIGFVVLDTLSSLAPDADETKDAPVITAGLNHLADGIQGTALLVHHPGWSQPGRVRGGYQFAANVDEILILSAASEGSEQLSVKVDKRKDGESGQIHYLRRLPVDLGLDEDGNRVTSVTVEHARLSDSVSPLRNRIAQYLAACGEIGASPAEIALELAVEKQSGGYKQALNGLVGDGTIRREGSTRASRYYLADDQ